MTLTILGETPSKKNSKVFSMKAKRLFPSKHFQDWHKSAISQIPFMDEVNYPCRISAVFYHGDLRPRDSDNQLSSILDLLVDSGVLVDDKWLIVRQTATENKLDRKTPRCEVTIEKLENAEDFGDKK